MAHDIGLIGLAVMGQNLALNMAERGFSVSVYNRTVSKVQEFVEGPAKGFSIEGFSDLKAFFKSLARPRKVILMVKAGAAVDELIAHALPFLEKGDILIDGGNSLFLDSQRRMEELFEKGILFMGVGISGGEEGARHGPSIMPGGATAAWPYLKPIFQKISAHVDGVPCCDWVGEGGAGHFVKMVHNGIEYADMQLISETYDILKQGLGFNHQELAKTFSGWNDGKLRSYLIQITAEIFAKKDTDGEPLVEKILDVAGQKGTGKWTVSNALDLGVPLTLVSEAVFSRYLSSLYDERKQVSSFYKERIQPVRLDKSLLEDALYAAKILSYTQGFMLMNKASQEYGWSINLGSCALMWRGGCIIRSVFLGKIKEAFDKNPSLSMLILDPFFEKELGKSLPALRQVVAGAAISGIPVPCLAAALTWFDGMRAARLPTNLIQAQRDLFGAHTFERLDRPRGEMFHADWSGE
jgi:6-phosphogluconate dehydrogenase